MLQTTASSSLLITGAPIPHGLGLLLGEHILRLCHELVTSSSGKDKVPAFPFFSSFFFFLFFLSAFLSSGERQAVEKFKHLYCMRCT